MKVCQPELPTLFVENATAISEDDGVEFWHSIRTFTFLPEMAAATSLGTTRRLCFVLPVLSFTKLVQVTIADAEPSLTVPFCTVQSAALSALPNQE